MWSFSRAARSAGLGIALAAPLVLAGCSGFAPVYGTNLMSSQRVELAIAPPSTRAEQIIYQDLRLRFAQPTGPAPKLRISATSTSAALTGGTVSTAQTPQQMTVTASITLTDTDGKTLFSGTRAQTADYNTGPQVLANNSAADDASKRAAHLLADTIRLTVLGALGR